jgi:hypothetical protein
MRALANVFTCCVLVMKVALLNGELEEGDLISVAADPVFNMQSSVVNKVSFVVSDQCHS